MKPGKSAYIWSNALLATAISLLLAVLSGQLAGEKVAPSFFWVICIVIYLCFFGLGRLMSRPTVLSCLWALVWSVVALIGAFVLAMISNPNWGGSHV